MLELDCQIPIGLPEKNWRIPIVRAMNKAQRREWGQGSFQWVILRRSIDARRKNDVHLHVRLALYGKGEGIPSPVSLENVPILQEMADEKNAFHVSGTRDKENERVGEGDRPVVVGTGPAGLFAAYFLSLAGMRPIVWEQGKPVDARRQDVERFWKEGMLHPWSNVQFGEGGAGTFSDGKLHTGNKDPWIQKVLNTFVDFGAPSEIAYDGQPHIGTDLLPDILLRMRERMVDLGAEFHFETQLQHLLTNDGQVIGVQGKNLSTGEVFSIPTKALFLGIGHSSRKTYFALAEDGVVFQSKPMAVGVRIEHPQSLIDLSQYGAKILAEHRKDLPAASYKLTYHTREARRGQSRAVYSFCMCPGGEVIASASAPQEVVTNGMSRYARDQQHANAALLVNVTPEDYLFWNERWRDRIQAVPHLAEMAKKMEQYPALSGLLFQECLEYQAFREGGSSYFAPSCRVGEFLERMAAKGMASPCEEAEHPASVSDFSMGTPTYQPGITSCDLQKVLPDFICESLAEALPFFAKKIHGYAHPEARLYAVESRSSAPIRMVRDAETRQNAVFGLYPIGEGAGYAGGITSSAVDGLRSVQVFLETMQKGEITERKA